MLDLAASSLVLTKLRVPPLRSRIVPRARLVQRFDPQTDASLVLVCAPAGSGKTTLLTQWARSQMQEGAAVAWFAADPSDDDPIPFGSYLVASLMQALGPISEVQDVAKGMRSSTEANLYRMMPAIINGVVESGRGCLLVLDDYQFVSKPEIHSAIAFLLEHLPENMRIIIGSRSDPPLPLARLRAHGRLLEVRETDLRFRADETETFLNDVMRLRLPTEVLATLQARTEGWVAGLQLAALSLSNRSVPEDFTTSFSSKDPYLFNYLLEEVVGCQPPDIQEFLLATSILERMCGPLCDAILGEDAKGELILNQLEQQNLFMVALDREGYWHRYHHLLREFLQAQLSKTQPERIPLLHRAASEWYASQGLLREAVQHALATQDWAYAADVVEKYGMLTLMHSEISTVYEWCATFPTEALRAHPMLCILQGWTLVLSYRAQNRRKIEELLQAAEQAAAALPDIQRGHWLAGQAAAVRTFLCLIPDPRADPQKQFALTRLALDLLPAADPLRSTITLTIAYAHMARHDAEGGYAVMEEAKRLSLAGGNYYGAVDASFHQARMQHALGKLDHVADICRQARAEIAALVPDAEREVPVIGCLDIALGCVLLEQDRLEDAERVLAGGLRLIEWTLNPFDHWMASVALFRLREIQGRSQEALAVLDRLQEAWPDIAFCTEALRMLHAIRTAPEDPRTQADVAAWTKAFTDSLGGPMPLPGIGPLGAAEAYYLACLAWVRAQITIGKADVALPYLERQLETATSQGLNHRIIELAITSALAWQAHGEGRRADEALERALRLAEPAGYIRIFDEGSGISRLLDKAAERGIARDYIGRIREACGHRARPHTQQSSGAGISPDGMLEALSERELQILRLMAGGASNQEIADQLVITVGTVKSHITHIFGKLNADSRTKAVARARELGLLEI